MQSPGCCQVCHKVVQLLKLRTKDRVCQMLFQPIKQKRCMKIIIGGYKKKEGGQKQTRK